MIEVMIDLETLGTQPGSVVMSVGAVASNDAVYLQPVSIKDQLYAGLTVDPSTLAWWKQQSREAWEVSSSGRAALSESLADFANWLMDLRRGSENSATGEKLRLWGDSASFDLTLLTCVYRAANVPVPWNYREECCYRTLRNVLSSEKPAAKLQHDALSDARAQMEHLMQMLQSLKTQPITIVPTSVAKIMEG